MGVRQWIETGGVCLFCVMASAGLLAQQTSGQQEPASTGPLIRSETRLVLVDTVVTDKKGNYLRDLTVKDFRVYEDKKEQNITSFSFEADPASPNNSQPHYLVLFFDNSTMETGDQMRARLAAARFIDVNGGSKRLMSIVNFGGTLQVAQNFTDDAARLKQVVSGFKFSAVAPNGGANVPGFTNAEADYGARTVLLALRSLAKNLGGVPGRKTLVLFTAGFPFTPEVESELTAVTDACNRSNVAIYPIDVRGLIAGSLFPRDLRQNDQVRFVNASFSPSSGGAAPPAGGGGGGGGSRGGAPSGGGTTGGGRTGSTGTAGGGRTGSTGTGTAGGGRTGNTGGYGGGTRSPTSPYSNNPFNPYNSSRSIIPRLPETGSTNQQILYVLASGTGGFVIANSNDLFGGIDKIAKDQNEYYLLGYTPEESSEGSCHTLNVKVDRGGTVVRARSGYCNAKAQDVLAGSPTEKELETRVGAAQPGNVRASLAAPFFYTSANTARVDVAMDIPAEALKFEKQKGKMHSTMNVLGITYKPDGAVAARFSDSVKLEFQNKKEVEAFSEKPLHYENQFDVAAGQYSLKVIFSSGGNNFGKLEMPLVIESWDSKQFSLSGIALSKELRKVADVTTDLDAQLLEGHTPLVSQGFQITPSGTNHFSRTDPALLYVEVYEPLLLKPNPPQVGVQIRILDKKTGEQKLDSGLQSVATMIRQGNPVIPVGLRLEVGKLVPGSYQVELKALDAVGGSKVRTADFEVE